MQSKTKKRALPTTEHESKRIFVAGAQAQHQVVIANIRGRKHLYLRRPNSPVVIYSRDIGAEFHYFRIHCDAGRVTSIRIGALRTSGSADFTRIPQRSLL